MDFVDEKVEEIFSKVRMEDNYKSYIELFKKKKMLGVLENWDAVDEKFRIVDFFGKSSIFNEKLLAIASDRDYQLYLDFQKAQRKEAEKKKRELKEKFSLLKQYDKFKNENGRKEKNVLSLTQFKKDFLPSNFVDSIITDKKYNKFAFYENCDTLNEVRKRVKIYGNEKKMNKSLSQLQILKKNEKNKNKVKNFDFVNLKKGNFMIDISTIKSSNLEVNKEKINSLSSSRLDFNKKESTNSDLKERIFSARLQSNMSQPGSAFRKKFLENEKLKQSEKTSKFKTKEDVLSNSENTVNINLINQCNFLKENPTNTILHSKYVGNFPPAKCTIESKNSDNEIALKNLSRTKSDVTFKSILKEYKKQTLCRKLLNSSKTDKISTPLAKSVNYFFKTQNTKKTANYV